MNSFFRLLSVALVAGAFFLSGLAGVGSAVAEEIDLKTALKNKGVSRLCGSSAMITATLNFVNENQAEPNQCDMFRYVSKSKTQCRCVQEILESGGEDPAAYLAELGLTDEAVACDKSMNLPENQPEFCAEGCACDDPLSSRSYK